MKLYKNLREKYNKNINKIIQKFSKRNKTKAKLKSTLKFLLKCRKSGLIPKFISNTTKHVEELFHFNNYKTKNDKIIKLESLLKKYIGHFQIKILNLIINFKHEEIKINEKVLERSKSYVQQNILERDFNLLCISELKLYDNIIKTKTKTQKKKFQDLKNLQSKKTHIKFNKDWFTNKSNTEIPINVQKLLSLGPKFALPLSKKQQFPMFKCIADGEEIIQTNKEQEKQEIARTQLVTTIHNYLNKLSLTTTEREIICTVDQTKKFLNKNKNILVLKADKGNCTVAMEKSEYETKMKTIVQDICTYKRLKKDPTTKLQTRNNKLVEKLFALNIINLKDRCKLLTNVAIAPRLYGLPKVHKKNMPMRPICSSINSPSYGLCKYIISILKNLTTNSKYNIKDAVEFKNKITKTNISDDEALISFDVISLFPSIPVNLAINIISKNWEKIEAFTNIPKDIFFDILRFCIKENRYFKYNDKIYEQLKGMPMGSPASPVIADIVMEELLDTMIEKLEHKPRLISKYVDDLFCIIKKSAVEETLKTLNSFHKDIKFTTELEKDGKLPFLDTLIIRKENTVAINWYQKPTATGRIINFYSNHPKHMKINTALNFAKRVLQISDEEFHNANIKKIRTTLIKNSFPCYTTKNIIKNAIDNFKNPPLPQPEEKVFKSMSYVSGFSERIAHSNIYDKKSVNIALKTTNCLNMLFSNTKTKTDKLEKSNVVYKIPCNGDGSNICEKVYIGTTKSKLKTRLAAHKSDHKTSKGKTDQKTALADHCATHGHSPNINSASILQQENNTKKRFIIEMLHIINTPANIRMNYKKDTENCAHTYRHLITTYKQKHQ